jgi:hypothetical protein
MRLLLSSLLLLSTLPLHAKIISLRITGAHPNGRTTCRKPSCDTGPRTATGKRVRAGDVAGPRWMKGRTIIILSARGRHSKVPRRFIGRPLRIVDVCVGGIDLYVADHRQAVNVGRGIARVRVMR